MRKVKITVLKCAFHEDLVRDFAKPGLGPCAYNREGMEFVCENGWQRPEGLCDNAWKSMMEYVFELAHLRVRHLLSMTVGQEQSWLMGASRPRMGTPDLVRLCLAQRFECEPGTRLRYTNVGPYLAGILVARRAGMSLADFWCEHLLKPQGFFRPSVEADPLGNTLGAGGLMVTTGHLLAMGRSLLARDGLVPNAWIDYVQQPGCADTWRQADGKFGQFSVAMQDKGAVLALTSDCETPHETLKAFWETVYPLL